MTRQDDHPCVRAGTVDLTEPLLLHEFFERQVDRHVDHCAIEFNGTKMSYVELEMLRPASSLPEVPRSGPWIPSRPLLGKILRAVRRHARRAQGRGRIRSHRS